MYVITPLDVIPRLYPILQGGQMMPASWLQS
ncbi:MAG: hypothetical protein IPG53_17685 [Ignavibacteriales bacterium]|nr:hypothetical protein [Ignavibacteriales bacterium]